MARRVPRRSIAGLAALAVALGGLSAGCTTASSPVTVVGTFQNELGCAADWQDSCAETNLPKVAEGTYSADLQLPGGAFEYRAAVKNAQPAANRPLVLGGPATLRFTYTEADGKLTVQPVGLAAADDGALAQHSLRSPGSTEQFYFVMTDRFANGATGNDRGGLSGGRAKTGYDPTDKAYYHGGDLKGVQQRLDYIQGLGTTAIWLTPVFKNRPVQGTGSDASASYHGYWTTDFTRIDPHLGTNQDMKDLIAAAHKRGMKVYFDIIVNHTADVIRYSGGGTAYIGKDERPYTDAAGNDFDDVEAAKTGNFPALDLETMAPYVPTFASASDAKVKKPDWLNDPRMYHNRGDSTWSGESDTYGDFIGLDDLWTERPEVVSGMIDIYKQWVDFGVDGFRLDTVKHVDLAFWRTFSPAIMEHARAQGRDFFMFGEVYSPNAMNLAPYSTTGRLPATLDFAFQEKAKSWLTGGSADELTMLWDSDDLYTDADSNAYASPTFLGNHDMGRIGMLLESSSDADELLPRARLAHSLMFLTRGQPVVYYGDEQGFIGSAGDADARQDMFATRVPDFAEQAVIGGRTGARSRYDTSHPLYRHIAALSKLRAQHPALVSGAMGAATADDDVLAFTRWRPQDDREYLVALNNTGAAITTTVTPSSGGQRTWDAVAGATGSVQAGADGGVGLKVPAFGYVVYSAPKAPVPDAELRLIAPPDGMLGSDTVLQAEWPGVGYGEVTFAARVVGSGEWTVLGTDDTVGYSLDPATAYQPGTLVEVRAIGRSGATTRAASVFLTAGA